MKNKISILLVFFALEAYAYIPADFPNYLYENYALSLEQATLNNNCYSIPSSRLGINCNPAFISESNTKKNFHLNFIFSDTISDVEAYAKNVNRDSSVDLINRSLNQDNPYLGQAQISLWFEQDNFAISLTPARVGVATDTRNPSLQEVSLHSSVQSELAARFGFFIDEQKRFSFGSNFRYNHTKFIRERFEVLSASVDPSFLKVKESDVVYIDPGVAFRFNDLHESMLSFTFTQVKLYKSGSDLPTKGTVELGYQIAPHIFKKRFKTSIHFTARKDYPDFEDRIGLGGIIFFDHNFNTNFSISKPKQSISILTNISNLTIGFGYTNERRNFNGYRKENFDYFLFQVGFFNNNHHHHAHE